MIQQNYLSFPLLLDIVRRAAVSVTTRFSGDALAVTAHMIIIADFSLTTRKHILTMTRKEERVIHPEYWGIIKFQNWKGSLRSPPFMSMVSDENHYMFHHS
jgi:hypothetical protein